MTAKRNHRSSLWSKKQAGIALVELAVVAPLLVLLIIVVTQLGYAFYLNNALLKALGDGAIYASANVIHNPTGVVDANLSATEATVKNIVVYGTPNNAGGAANIKGLTTGMVTLTAVDSAHVQVTIAGYDLTTAIGSFFSCSIDLGFGALNICPAAWSTWSSVLVVTAL